MGRTPEGKYHPPKELWRTPPDAALRGYMHNTHQTWVKLPANHGLHGATPVQGYREHQSSIHVPSDETFETATKGLLVVLIKESRGEGNRPCDLKRRDAVVVALWATCGQCGQLCMTGLRRLSIDCNSFRGILPEGGLKTLTSLAVLNLHDNKFIGIVPGEGLSSRLPEELGGMLELRYFQVSNNALIGSLPVEGVKGMALLSSFEVDANSFAGMLPTETFRGKPLLKNLRVNCNMFTGLLPNGGITCTGVKLALFNMNNFRGSLPVMLVSWSELCVLNVYNNYLQGALPSITSMLSLYNLVAGSNLLAGSVPN
eukprot:2003443-Amphidinium_carterae.1